MPLNDNTPKVRNNPNEHRKQDESVIAAHDQAEKDMSEDPDLNLQPSPEDDMDEGEAANYERKDEKK